MGNRGASQPNDDALDRSELGVAELVSRVREELETLDTNRQASGKPALFSLEQLELELQFTAVERTDGHGGIDLKVISVGGALGVESSAVQVIRLQFGLDAEALELQVPGVRGKSNTSLESQDTEALELNEPNS